MEVRETTQFSSWLAALRDRQARARILVRITRLAQGNPGDVKPVGNDVLELRLTYGPGYRIYYFKPHEELILLLVGGSKSTQKKDIESAHKLANKLSEQNNERN